MDSAPRWKYSGVSLVSLWLWLAPSVGLSWQHVCTPRRWCKSLSQVRLSRRCSYRQLVGFTRPPVDPRLHRGTDSVAAALVHMLIWTQWGHCVRSGIENMQLESHRGWTQSASDWKNRCCRDKEKTNQPNNRSKNIPINLCTIKQPKQTCRYNL